MEFIVHNGGHSYHLPNGHKAVEQIQAKTTFA